jgi:hypothetical protein
MGTNSGGLSILWVWDSPPTRIIRPAQAGDGRTRDRLERHRQAGRVVPYKDIMSRLLNNPALAQVLGGLKPLGQGSAFAEQQRAFDQQMQLQNQFGQPLPNAMATQGSIEALIDERIAAHEQRQHRTPKRRKAYLSYI